MLTMATILSTFELRKHPHSQNNEGDLGINSIPCESGRTSIRTVLSTTNNHIPETHEPP